MKNLLLTVLFLGISLSLTAQDNVGIGTTSPNPSSILELVSANQGFLMTRLNGSDTSTIGNAGANEGMMFYALNDNVFYYFDGSKWVSLSVGTNYWGASGTDIYNLNSGRIGIGTNSPATDFHMEGSTYNVRIKSTQSTSLASTQIQFGRDNGGGGFTETGSIGDPGSGDYLQIASPQFIHFNTNFGIRMWLDGTGQLGIGSSSPTATLDVDGNVRIRDLGGNGNQIVTVDNNGYLDTVNLSSTILWAENGDDIYNLNSGGVSIGGTTTNLKLQVVENALTTNPVLAIQNQNTSGDVSYGFNNSGSGTSYTMGIDASDGNHFKIANGSTLGTNDRIWLNANGNLGIGVSPGSAIRVFSYVEPGNTTTRYGLRADNYYNGASTKFGTYNNVSTDGTGTKYGTYNVVGQSAGIATATYGVFNFLNHDGTGTSYGVYNNSTSATTSGNVYGVYNVGEDYNYFEGDVGVGINLPESELHVYTGAGPSAGGLSSLIDLYIESNTQSFLEFNAGDWSGVSFNDDNQSVRAGYLFNPISDIISIKAGGSDNRLVVDANGDVGIGAGTNPVNRLDVEGGAAIGAGYSGTNVAPTNGLIVEGGTGIGVNSVNPAYKVHVNTGFGSTERFAGIFQADYDGTSAAYGLYSWMTGAGSGNHYGVYISNGSATSGTEYGLYSTGEDMNYLSNNVGIGTTTPVNLLDVEGGVAIGSSYSGSTVAPTNGLIVEGSQGVGVSFVNSAYKMHVNTGFGGNERYAGLFQADYDGTSSAFGLYSWMTGAGSGTHYGVYVSNSSATTGTEYGIYCTGEDRNYFSNTIGIGTTSPSSQGRLHVAASSAAFDANSSYGIKWVTGNTMEAHIFRWVSNDRLYFTNNGNGNLTGVYLADGATWWTSTSDRRLKENIVETSYGLKDILKLKVKEYNYKNTDQNEKEIGLIAQEVYEVIPEVVQKGDDGAYRGEGNAESSQELGFDPWGIEYSGLIPVLVKSVQELKAENDELRKRIDEIENK